MANRASGKASNVIVKALMQASNEDVVLSASSIAESLFCLRAAVLNHESLTEERPEDPSFDVMAIYELQVLDAAIVRTFWLSVLSVMGITLLLITAFETKRRGNYFLLFLTVAIGAKLAGYLIDKLRILFKLLAKRAYAQVAQCAEPDISGRDLQPVTWWGMLNRGFESIRFESALYDSQWRVRGKPWRVLKRDSLRIPVFRTRSVADQPTPQHVAKLMAYCHLLIKCEGFDSPYGIVLMGSTYRGFVVLNNESNSRQFQNALLNMREVAWRVETRHQDPLAPAQPRKCSDCPWGEPRLVSLRVPTTRHDEALAPYRIVARNESYHCSCGDRFRWKPYHDDNWTKTEVG